MSRNKIFLLLGVCLIIVLALGTSVVGLAQETYTIRLAHGQPTTDVFHLSSVKFKEFLEEDTNGRVKVDIYPASQLGPIRDLVEGLRLGTIQAVWDGPARLSVYTNLADIFKVPYLLRDRDHGEKAWESKAGKKLFDEIAEQSGIEIVCMAWRGARQVTSTKSFSNVDELKGLKIRVPPYEITTNTWRVLGASPTPMDMNEIYLSLQQGVIDAQENAIMTCTSNRFYEVVDYLVLTAHNMDFGCLLMGSDYLEKLPVDIREAVYQAANKAAQFHGDYIDAEESKALELWRKNGVKIIEPDRAAFEKELDRQNFVSKYCSQFEEYINGIKAVE